MRRNVLRPNDTSLQLPALKALPALRELDLTFNPKCRRQTLADRLSAELPSVVVKMRVVDIGTAPPGAFDGDCAADRDATLLRAQLEPLGTLALRRRLVSDFGQAPTDPETVLRADVMSRLLDCYAAEGLLERTLIRANGTPVRPELCAQLLAELQAWVGKEGTSERTHPTQQERPSINAQSYMILRSPAEFENKITSSGKGGSRKAKLAKSKYEQNLLLWNLANQAMEEADP